MDPSGILSSNTPPPSNSPTAMIVSTPNQSLTNEPGILALELAKTGNSVEETAAIPALEYAAKSKEESVVPPPFVLEDLVSGGDVRGIKERLKRLGQEETISRLKEEVRALMDASVAGNGCAPGGCLISSSRLTALQAALEAHVTRHRHSLKDSFANYLELLIALRFSLRTLYLQKNSKRTIGDLVEILLAQRCLHCCSPLQSDGYCRGCMCAICRTFDEDLVIDKFRNKTKTGRWMQCSSAKCACYFHTDGAIDKGLFRPSPRWEEGGCSEAASASGPSSSDPASPVGALQGITGGSENSDLPDPHPPIPRLPRSSPSSPVFDLSGTPDPWSFFCPICGHPSGVWGAVLDMLTQSAGVKKKDMKKLGEEMERVGKMIKGAPGVAYERLRRKLEEVSGCNESVNKIVTELRGFFGVPDRRGHIASCSNPSIPLLSPVSGTTATTSSPSSSPLSALPLPTKRQKREGGEESSPPPPPPPSSSPILALTAPPSSPSPFASSSPSPSLKPHSPSPAVNPPSALSSPSPLPPSISEGIPAPAALLPSGIRLQLVNGTMRFVSDSEGAGGGGGGAEGRAAAAAGGGGGVRLNLSALPWGGTMPSAQPCPIIPSASFPSAALSSGTTANSAAPTITPSSLSSSSSRSLAGSLSPFSVTPLPQKHEGLKPPVPLFPAHQGAHQANPYSSDRMDEERDVKPDLRVLEQLVAESKQERKRKESSHSIIREVMSVMDEEETRKRIRAGLSSTASLLERMEGGKEVVSSKVRITAVADGTRNGHESAGGGGGGGGRDRLTRLYAFSVGKGENFGASEGDAAASAVTPTPLAASLPPPSPPDPCSAPGPGAWAPSLPSAVAPAALAAGWLPNLNESANGATSPSEDHRALEADRWMAVEWPEKVSPLAAPTAGAGAIADSASAVPKHTSEGSMLENGKAKELSMSSSPCNAPPSVLSELPSTVPHSEGQPETGAVPLGHANSVVGEPTLNPPSTSLSDPPAPSAAAPVPASRKANKEPDVAVGVGTADGGNGGGAVAASSLDPFGLLFGQGDIVSSNSVRSGGGGAAAPGGMIPAVGGSMEKALVVAIAAKVQERRQELEQKRRLLVQLEQEEERREEELARWGQEKEARRASIEEDVSRKVQLAEDLEARAIKARREAEEAVKEKERKVEEVEREYAEGEEEARGKRERGREGRERLAAEIGEWEEKVREMEREEEVMVGRVREVMKAMVSQLDSWGK